VKHGLIHRGTQSFQFALADRLPKEVRCECFIARLAKSYPIRWPIWL